MSSREVFTLATLPLPVHSWRPGHVALSEYADGATQRSDLLARLITPKGIYNHLLVQVMTCVSGSGKLEWQAMGSELVLRALAEPHRRAILRLVRNGPRSAGDIATHFDVTQQAISQHLQVLAAARLVRIRKDGKRRLYVVNPQALEALDRFLAHLWPAGLQRLKRAVESRHG